MEYDNKELNHYGLCPICGKSWDNGDIFDVFRKDPYYEKTSDEDLWEIIVRSYRKPYKFSYLIGIEIRGKYDGISCWKCPFCETTWDRWTLEVVNLDENS